jgi:hypothetical protein
MNSPPIYRFTFTEDCMNELNHFSKVHQYDKQKDFKEAWATWVAEHSGLLEEETQRLTGLGFHGNVADKMYKSARFYFRKKREPVAKPEPRKEYERCSPDILNRIVQYIEMHPTMQPKLAFAEFWKEQGRERWNQSSLKKTYQNRYSVYWNHQTTTAPSMS